MNAQLIRLLMAAIGYKVKLGNRFHGIAARDVLDLCRGRNPVEIDERGIKDRAEYCEMERVVKVFDALAVALKEADITITTAFAEHMLGSPVTKAPYKREVEKTFCISAGAPVMYKLQRDQIIAIWSSSETSLTRELAVSLL